MIYKFLTGGEANKFSGYSNPNLPYAASFTLNGLADMSRATAALKNFVWKKGANRVGDVDAALLFLNDRGLSNINVKDNVAGGNPNVYGTRYAGAAAYMLNLMNSNNEFKLWYAQNSKPGTGDVWKDLVEDGFWGPESQKMFDKYKLFISRNDNPTTLTNPTLAANPTYLSPYRAFDATKYDLLLGNSKLFFLGWKDYFTDFNNKGRKNWKNNGRYEELIDNIGLHDAGMALYLRSKYLLSDGTWNVNAWRKDFGRNMGSHNYKDLIRDYSMYAASRNANAQRALNTWLNNPTARDEKSLALISGLTPGTIYFSNDGNYLDVYSTNNVDWSKGNGVGANGKLYNTATYTDSNGLTVTKKWDAENNKWGDPVYGNIMLYLTSNVVSPYLGVNLNYKTLFNPMAPESVKTSSNKFGGRLMYKYQDGGNMPQLPAGSDDIQQQVEQLVLAAMSGDEEATKVIQSILEAALNGDLLALQMLDLIQLTALSLQGGDQVGTVTAKYGAKLNYIARLRGECPQGYHLELFKAGGRICKKCQRDAQRAIRREKVEKKACGGATKSMNSIKALIKSKRK